MEAGEDLAVFANLSGDQIRIIAGVFDESVLEKRLDIDRIRDASGADLTDSAIESINRIFYNFFHGMTNESENLAHAINTSDLTREKRAVLLDTLEKIRGGTNKDGIRRHVQRDTLKTFGHPHLDQPGIPPECGSTPIRKSAPKPDRRTDDTGSKGVDLLSVLGIDSDCNNAPKTIIGLLKDYTGEGDNSRDLVRAVRDGV